MPGKKYKCGGCQRVMRSDNLNKHEKICRGSPRKESSVDSSLHHDLKKQPTLNPHERQKDDVGDIMNSVVRRAGFDVQSKKRTVPSKTPRVVLPAAVKPKSLTQLAIEQECSEPELTDSAESESDSEDESIDVNFMSGDPSQLMRSFRNLYTKFDDNIRSLLLTLKELERMNCLSSEECRGIKNHLQKKVEA